MSFLELPLALWRKVTASVNDVRQQAPAARMVGEFAVKHVATEASKKISDITNSSDTKSNPQQ